LSACPENRCDGSGFVYDDGGRRARPCACRPGRIARKRAAALEGRIPRRYREVSFDREPLPTLERTAPYVVREVREYVQNVSERIVRGQGIWFTGDVGTGKTTLAMLVSKAALEANHSVAIYSLPRLLGVLRETFNDASRYSLSEFIDRLTKVDLLHIDDVGAEQTSAWVLEQLYTIVNTRYEDGRALVLTTNLVLKDAVPAVHPDSRAPVIDPATGKPQMEAPDAALVRQIGERTVSRLYEVCGTPLMLFGGDSRPRGGVDLTVVPTGEPPNDEIGAAARADRPDDAFWEGAGRASRYGRPEAGLGRRP
jgi:DNA replication protein DnaC